MPLGAIISAGASLLGGALGRRSQQNVADDNARLQREFAQHGIRWRVADALAAGVHPLYAMGANVPTYSPTSFYSDPLGEGISAAGQDIGRAVEATRTKEERVSSHATRLQNLQLERAGLENDLLRMQIASEQAKLYPPNPPFPSAEGSGVSFPGQGQVLEVEPSREPGVHRDSRYSMGGVYPDVQFGFSGSGQSPYPPQGLIEDQEVTNPLFLEWIWNNRIAPYWNVPLGKGKPPSDELLPPDAYGWRWSPTAQEWHPVYSPNWLERLHSVPRKSWTFDLR